MGFASGIIKGETIKVGKSTGGGSIVINTVDPEQLDRIESKLDRIIELLEGEKQSIKLDGKSIAEIVNRENVKRNSI